MAIGDVQPGGAAAAGRFSGQVASSFSRWFRRKLWPLLVIGVLNTVLSLFYYLRVVRVMVFSPEPLYRDAPEIPLLSLAGSYCALLTLPVVVLFFLVGGLVTWATLAANAFFPLTP